MRKRFGEFINRSSFSNPIEPDKCSLDLRRFLPDQIPATPVRRLLTLFFLGICIWTQQSVRVRNPRADLQSCSSVMSMHERFLLISMFFTMSVTNGSPVDHQDTRILNAGAELWKETLPLQMGSRLYQLEGLKSYTWYEVKISYPASIPARFTLQLKKGISEVRLNRGRKLLDTEKIMFKTESIDPLSNQDVLYVLVIVEPEGVVAIPHVKERETIIFNIVCDELLLWIPLQTWWVVTFVILCLVAAFIIPFFLPSYMLPLDDRKMSSKQQGIVTKHS